MSRSTDHLPKASGASQSIFDPREVPIVSRDSHMPAVELSLLTPDALRLRFTQEKQWEAEVTDENRAALAREGSFKAGRGNELTPAAVLIPLIIYENELKILLTQRTAHLHDHPGQISFPGGRSDSEDISAVDTALREAEEEIGLPSDRVEVLGSLPHYLTITGYQVTPVVSLVVAGHAYEPDEFEVADIFEVPMAYLMNPHHHEQRMWQSPQGYRRFYAIPYENKFIWGATAGMLRNLYHFLKA
jgi:8-oxo-dGTP pyrophosphatase MutT (NUDIX family)|uniref:CoA pyrophosphatase n=1 Tax=Polynucleobacter sp. TaxID=2029855 RepID=UPI00404854EC